MPGANQGTYGYLFYLSLSMMRFRPFGYCTPDSNGMVSIDKTYLQKLVGSS